MKTKGTFFSIVLLLISTFVLAGTDPAERLAVVKSGNKVYKLIYEGVGDAPITISLNSPDGSSIFTQRISSKTGFICPLNFTGMKPGLYRAVVAQGGERFTTAISYTDVVADAYARIRNVAERKYAVLVPNSEELITVAIYDSQQNVVATYSEKASGAFGKVFDLSKMPVGAYTMVVSQNEKVIETKTL